ncbi:MAG TPA: hypothetical protein VFG67_11515 [Oleiagrimonas sp.]|nr:hypothetical protein [Oleiagrimonas sp.]
MERVTERNNLWQAYHKVIRNVGAPGVDGLTVAAFKDWLKVHWPTVKAALLAGQYQPSAVRAVDIPKLQGGVRTLGIPTVLDRLIQQALLQVLQPIVEPTFSASSYGFIRPIHGAPPAGPAFGCSKSFQTILSTGAQCSSSGTGSQTLRAGRARMGSGHGLGEVLRPGQPRHPDVAGGTACPRPAGMEGTGWLVAAAVALSDMAASQDAATAKHLVA